MTWSEIFRTLFRALMWRLKPRRRPAPAKPKQDEYPGLQGAVMMIGQTDGEFTPEERAKLAKILKEWKAKNYHGG